MKNLLLLLIILFSFTGCSFLKGAADSEDAEELAHLEGEESMDEEEEMDEEADEEEEWDEEEEEEMDEEAEEEEGEEEWDEEDEEEEEWDEEEEEEMDEEADEEEVEEEGKKEKKGFFARIFGWGDDDEEDEMEEEEEIDDEEAEEEEWEEEEWEEEGEMEYDDSGSDFGEETDFGDEEPDTTNATDEGMLSSQPAAPAETPSDPVIEEEKPRIIPLKKIKRTAYRKGAYLVNAVYIARKGDTIESVSQKIYNSDQKAVLYTINPHLRSRSVKVGDKIYYSSPRRPQDDSGIFIYYEELGAPPRIHVISPGENIRSVSKNLLGHENSWKEIWATNPGIASKGVVSEAIELKYWLDVSPAAEAPAPDSPDMSEDEGMEQPIDMAEEEGMEGDVMLEEEGQAEEEEEDSDEVLDPVVDTNRKKKAAEWVIIVGVFLLILLSLATLVIKKRRGKREFDYTSTNIQPLS